MTTYRRTITDNKSGEVHHFGSVDGDIWIGIDREPTADDHDGIIALMEGEGRTKPMTIASRWFHFGLGDWATAGEVEEL